MIALIQLENVTSFQSASICDLDRNLEVAFSL